MNSKRLNDNIWIAIRTALIRWDTFPRHASHRSHGHVYLDARVFPFPPTASVTVAIVLSTLSNLTSIHLSAHVGGFHEQLSQSTAVNYVCSVKRARWRFITNGRVPVASGTCSLPSTLQVYRYFYKFKKPVQYHKNTATRLLNHNSGDAIVADQLTRPTQPFILTGSINE